MPRAGVPYDAVSNSYSALGEGDGETWRADGAAAPAVG